jgi:hypothetical protein
LAGAHSLAKALADSAAASLVRRVADSQRVAEALAGADLSLLPAFDPLAPGTCDLREKTLVLFVGSTASAAKMRQSLPQLLGWLNRQGFELTEIKLRLQPERMSYRLSPDDAEGAENIPTTPGASGQYQPNATGALALAEKLALTFPDTSVGNAASRLAARLRTLLAQTG